MFDPSGPRMQGQRCNSNALNGVANRTWAFVLTTGDRMMPKTKTIWIVVHGEELIPEGFPSREDAEMFIELDKEGGVKSGPWEVTCTDDECFTRYEPLGVADA